MAEDNSIYANPEPVSNYCYADKQTGVVEAILAFTLFGVFNRVDGSWVQLTRESPEFDKYINGDYDVWKIDLDTDPVYGSDIEDAGDDNEYEHALVLEFDSGKKLTESDLSANGYANKLLSTLEDPKTQE